MNSEGWQRGCANASPLLRASKPPFSVAQSLIPQTWARRCLILRSAPPCTLLAPGPVRPDERDGGANEVDENVPDFLWTSTEDCARDSLDALAGNRLRVVPGALSKAMDTAGNYLPRRLVAPIIGRFYEGMSQ